MPTTLAAEAIYPRLHKTVSRWKELVEKFLFPIESDVWLAVFRIGCAIQVLLYTLSLGKDWSYLFSGTENGFIGRVLSEGILSEEGPLVPRIGWLVALGGKMGLSEGTILTVAWWLLFLAGCALLLGVYARFAAITAWFLHLCAAKSGGFLSYGVDTFMTIALFYLMLMPLPDRYALDWHWRRTQPQDRHLLGFFRRVLQLHLCLIYFFSGLTKCLGSGWWDGSNIWRALIRPPFNLIPAETLVGWKYVLPAAGIFVCLLELTYSIFIWPKKTRAVWLMGILLMHFGIGLAMGMYLFALIMIVLNLAAFGAGVFSFGSAKVPFRKEEELA